VADAARELGLEVEVREFPEGTRTAEDAARAIGVSVGQIVKSLVFLAGDQPIVCLVSGSNRLDPSRLTQFVGEKIRRADADAVRAATGFAVGGVPPFGYPSALPVYCDRDLLDFEVVWAAAGTPHSVFAVNPDALVAASNATVLELKEQA
jgi:prolyl-tRNA editing enzyme YbaK/EbsC (Cys-tRNA(Pro) deacylase)